MNKKPSKAQQSNELNKRALKKVAAQIVLAQGNTFIKELLRSNKIPIGNTKADFAQNLNAAIDAGALTQGAIEAWLGEIEGWGNQHVYLFEPPAISKTGIRPALEASKHAELLVRRVSYEFPNRPTLSTINLSGDHLSITWHRGRGGWERAKSKDFQRDEGPDSFEYRAYREHFDRSVVRFEWRLHQHRHRIVIRRDGRIVAEHPRSFGRGETTYDPWHYVPVLARKPRALRNGARFKDWVLPAAIERVRRKLAGADDGNRQMVDILNAVLTDGLQAVEAACAEAIAHPARSSTSSPSPNCRLPRTLRISSSRAHPSPRPWSTISPAVGPACSATLR
jgi:hypothetical protein